MELLMENKGKVMDNYLSNLKFTLPKTGLKMLCHAALICTIYCISCRYDLHCDMSGDWNGEVSWFVPPLSLSQSCQPDHKKQFIKKLLSNLEYVISKTKDKFLTTTVIIFYINIKTCCTYFTPLMPGGSIKSNILKQTYSQKLLFILSMYDLLLPPGMRVLKTRNCQGKSFT